MSLKMKLLWLLCLLVLIDDVTPQFNTDQVPK